MLQSVNIDEIVEKKYKYWRQRATNGQMNRAY